MALYLQNLASNIPNPAVGFIDPLRQRLDGFRAKIFFQIECGAYRIETAGSPDDLRQALKLRRHSFLEEFIGEAPPEVEDFDEFDLIADHVLVRNLNTNEVIGCYRIICSEFTDRFYSENQFTLKKLTAEKDIKIELGRACIHKNYRNGVTLNLVWKGLAQYALLARARYMFGCASVRTTSSELAYSMFWHLYPMYYNSQYKIGVLPEFFLPPPSNLDAMPSWQEVEAAMPALLKSYLQAGAAICSEPALDNYFQCIDFFTVMDLTKLNPKYFRRYFA